MKATNVQNDMLNQLRKNKDTVNIYVINGVSVKGIISAFDDYVILVTTATGQKRMLYKHAVSTIDFPLNFKSAESKTGNSN